MLVKKEVKKVHLGISEQITTYYLFGFIPVYRHKLSVDFG